MSWIIKSKYNESGIRVRNIRSAVGKEIPFIYAALPYTVQRQIIIDSAVLTRRGEGQVLSKVEVGKDGN